MWINFGISLTILGLIHRVKCEDIPFSDMYLPDGTNGFVCQLDFFAIDHAREAAKRGIELFFSKSNYRKYPKIFEDTNLFNVRSEILVSWPILPSQKLFMRIPGKARLILNIRGQIIGMVMIDSKGPHQKISFEKCKPVRRALEEGEDEKIYLNQIWSVAHPTFGYSCGSKFFPDSTVNSVKGPESIKYYQNILIGKNKLSNLENFTGDEFRGDDLYSYPVHHKTSNHGASGPPGKFRAVVDMSNGEFKGIVNIRDKDEKCASVWDISSVSSTNIYTSSSTLNLHRSKDSYWPETCLGRKFKSKTMWLYLELALKNWMSASNEGYPDLPHIEQEVVRFWPVRTEESYIDSLDYVFAIAHHTKLDTYSLYRGIFRKDKFKDLRPCMKFSENDIRHLQRHIEEKHDHEKTYPLGS